MKSQILYVEKELDIPNPEIELLSRTRFLVRRATTLEQANEVLQDEDIGIILIDLYMTSDPEWGNNCIEFIDDPCYKDIAKIVIDVERDALGVRYKTLEMNSSVVHFHYKVEPDRHNKLMTVLQKHLL